MTLCWGLLILEDNENGCVIYNGHPKDTFNTNIVIPYHRIVGFETFGNYICITDRGNQHYFIDCCNETDHEKAIEHLCNMDIFYDQASFMVHQGEFDLSFGGKLIIGNKHLYRVDQYGYCDECVYLGDIDSVKVKDEYVIVKISDDVGSTWRTMSRVTIQSYGGTRHFRIANETRRQEALEIIQSLLRERDKQ